jgi:hypothetical protein
LLCSVVFTSLLRVWVWLNRGKSFGKDDFYDVRTPRDFRSI